MESLTLSSSFKFDKFQDFPEIISNDQYSGKWVNTEEPYKVFSSSKAFLEEFSSADAGTYIRQEVYSIKYVLDELASHNNVVSYNQYEGIPELEPAQKDYATFMGWYDENMNLIESIPQNMNRDITLTAKFSDHEFAITYVLDDGVNHEENPTSYKYGIGVTEFKKPTKLGYDFIAWYDEQGNVITSLDTSANADITLYAKYEAKEYHINYDLDGGINNEKNPSSYVFGEGVTEFFNPVKDNYQFMGWVDAEGTSIKSISKIDSGDRLLKAVWKENKIDDKDQNDSKEKTPPTGVEDVTYMNVWIVLISSLFIFVMKKKKA